MAFKAAVSGFSACQHFVDVGLLVHLNLPVDNFFDGWLGWLVSVCAASVGNR
jgi:hypothetical protein